MTGKDRDSTVQQNPVIAMAASGQPCDFFYDLPQPRENGFLLRLVQI